MDTNMSKVNFMGEEDLVAEIASQRSKLDFSQVKKGPDCDGCFSISFDTDCGHAYVYRKRCNIRDLVCTGSGILSVHLQDIVLRRKGCGRCRFLKVDNHRYKQQNLKRKRGQCALSPEQMAAKLRLEEGKERWKRQCLEYEGRGLLSSESADSQASLQRKAAHVEVIDLTGDDSE